MTQAFVLTTALATLAWGQTPPLTIVDAASLSAASGVAPDSIAAAFGQGLAPAFAAAGSATLPTDCRDHGDRCR